MELAGLTFFGFIAAFAGWLYAEFRGRKGTRIMLGIAAITLLAAFTPTITQWGVWMHVQCLNLIDRKLEVGDVLSVRRAIHVHNDVYATKGSTAAASSLLRTLQEADPPDSRRDTE